MFQPLIDLMDSYVAMGIPGYDCIVYKDGRQVFRHSGGYASLEEKTPITGNERYNIYSCSKPITCTAALQLWEKGAFSLDDKLADYMPEFREMTVKTKDGIAKAQNSITIKDLFCMTAGFSYNIASPKIKLCKQETEGRCPTRKAMEYLAQEPLVFEPGTRWNYSLCHDVLAALVEVLSGDRFGEYVRKNIFAPLGMNRSTFLLPQDELHTVAEHYRFDHKERVARNCGKNIQGYKLGSEYESGGAGAISTVDDYIKFLEALRVGDVILKNETVEMMSQNHLTPQQAESYPNPNYRYGLGVRVPIEGISCDFGWGGAAGSYLAIDRKSNITLFYAQHLLNSPNQDSRGQVFQYAYKALL